MGLIWLCSKMYLKKMYEIKNKNFFLTFIIISYKKNPTGKNWDLFIIFSFIKLTITTIICPIYQIIQPPAVYVLPSWKLINFYAKMNTILDSRSVYVQYMAETRRYFNNYKTCSQLRHVSQTTVFYFQTNTETSSTKKKQQHYTK